MKEGCKEVRQDLQKTRALLEKVHAYFQSLGFSSIRLTLVGGEPLLFRSLDKLIEIAYGIGFRVSMVTNGSQITDDFIIQQAGRLSSIGFSIDTIHNKTMHDIGRICRSGSVVDPDKLAEQIRLLRVCNQNILIKINTVINRYNFEEEMTPFIDQVKPDKWKIFRVLPIIKPETAITDEQFSRFLQIHQKFSAIWTVEDNDAMIGSYIMIDPLGRFFDNAQNQNAYVYSQSILEVGVEKAFQQVHFDLNKFTKRYKNEINLKQAC